MARYANSEMTVLCEQIALVNVGGKIVKTFARFGGERGIKPDVWYSLSAAGEFIEVSP